MPPDYVFQHAACLRMGTVLRAGPGDIAVIMQSTVTVELPRPGCKLELVPGQTLYSRHVPDLAQAVRFHLHGTSRESDLRRGVSMLLVALDPTLKWLKEGTPSVMETRIDEWLDQNTAIALGTMPPGMMRRDIYAPLNSVWREGPERTPHC